MTANLTVPADVWVCKQPGVPIVAAIVEGVDLLNPALGWRGPGGAPPAWLVALRDARCETCEGHGYRVHPEDGSSEPCDDGCHDGRLLHDVRVECPHIDDRDTQDDCSLCDDDGYRTVRCLVDVAEVRSNEAGDACHDKDDHLDVIGDGTVQTMFDGHDDELETAHVDALAAACGKPPADWVGGYAVILTTTRQDAE